MITFLEAKRAGLFGQGKIVPNVAAGVIIGVVALPLAMAFAIASGAWPAIRGSRANAKTCRYAAHGSGSLERSREESAMGRATDATGACGPH